MHAMSLRYFLIFFLALVCFVSCDDDDDPEASRRELLTAETWRGDRILVSGADAATSPLFRGFVPDPKSMTIKFNDNGTYTGTYTLNGQARTSSGTWEFKDNERKITGNLFGLASEADIETLNDQNLHLRTKVDVPDFPLPVPVEIRLVR